MVAARKSKSKRQPAKRSAKGARKKAPAKRKAPQYASLAELRRAIDALDSAIVPMLCRRLALVRSAAQFKPSHDGVVVQSRVEEIVARVRALADKHGCNADTLEAVYRAIIDAFTLEEQRNWKLLNQAEA